MSIARISESNQSECMGIDFHQFPIKGINDVDAWKQYRKYHSPNILFSCAADELYGVTNPDVFNYLIEEGADPYHIESNISSFAKLMENKNICPEIVANCFTKPTNPNFRNMMSEFPLSLFIWLHNANIIDGVRKFVDLGADINRVSKSTGTPLMSLIRSAIFKHKKVSNDELLDQVKALIELGADPNKKVNPTDTTLFSMCWINKLDNILDYFMDNHLLKEYGLVYGIAFTIYELSKDSHDAQTIVNDVMRSLFTIITRYNVDVKSLVDDRGANLLMNLYECIGIDSFDDNVLLALTEVLVEEYDISPHITDVNGLNVFMYMCAPVTNSHISKCEDMFKPLTAQYLASLGVNTGATNEGYTLFDQMIGYCLDLLKERNIPYSFWFKSISNLIATMTSVGFKPSINVMLIIREEIEPNTQCYYDLISIMPW